MNEDQPFTEVLARAGWRRARPADISSRLPAFPGTTVPIVPSLRRLRIGILGTGSVGSTVAFHCSKFQPAALYLADPKFVTATSLLTHAFGPGCLGRRKAFVTARFCKDSSPLTRVFAFAGRAQDLPLDALADVDLVIMATDNLPGEVAIGQLCLHLGKPLVHASLHGETLTVQVRFFSNSDGRGACPACLYGSVERRQLDEDIRYSCEPSKPASAAARIADLPTMTPSYLSAMAADLAVNQVIRHTLRLGEPVEDTLVEYCGYTNRTVTSRLERNVACPCDHTRFALAKSGRALSAWTVPELARRFGFSMRDRSLTVRLGETTWVERGVCRCADPKPVARFAANGRKVVGRCSVCHATIRVHPFYAVSILPVAATKQLQTKPLGRLGANDVQWALLRNAAQATLVRGPRSKGIEP